MEETPAERGKRMVTGWRLDKRRDLELDEDEDKNWMGVMPGKKLGEKSVEDVQPNKVMRGMGRGRGRAVVVMPGGDNAGESSGLIEKRGVWGRGRAKIMVTVKGAGGD